MLTLAHLSRRKNDDGAAAVVAAFAALLSFTFAALSVDLGNALARKGDTQVQVDFAALAGAALLTGKEKAGDESFDDPAVLEVAQYLVNNAANNDAYSELEDYPSAGEMAIALVDGVESNGQVRYLGGGRMRVVSPSVRVDFGFSGVFSLFGDASTSNMIDVGSDATVMSGSPKGNSALPMYVANPSPGGANCSYGLQTLTDPPGGHTVPPTVPTLHADGDTNDTSLTDITVSDAGYPSSSIAVGSTGGSITITGKYKDARKVGFFRSDDASLPPVMVDRSDWTHPVGTELHSANNGSVTVRVPSDVTASDVLWYARVLQGGGGGANKWSAKAEAQPVSIGDAPFECVGESSEGNFGTLKMPRSTQPSTWIELNIARGLEGPMTVTKFPGTPPPWSCAGDPLAVTSTSAARRPGTNCLDTDTGLTSQTATPGFITGGSAGGGYKGLLDTGSSSPDPDGSGGCAPAGTTAPRVVLGRHLNNDLLTCFLTDDATELGTVARANYTGDPKFHPAIYESPRFAWVPVFGAEPSSGGSNLYSIVDFRPAFIADQPMTATKGNRALNDATNGLRMSSNGHSLETLKVIFLNVNALPDGEAHTPVGPYLGTGPILIRLID